ncbi:hypothetical protein B7R54_00260 [Subtercola boreus]|uniref:DUF4062 domain-containing protein n=1 Tax=Subtercola boreus TaxID=120213 RepID=A0A3E0VD32_9MICO|nr:DUF4062 domain-containing protein [Subtercola boreus]RFA07816.1 hypothetical protein B7R54_00260 [Subtercola boreus]
MGRKLIGRRIFVASPGDVADERKLVSQIVDEFNSTEGFNQGTAYFVRGWEHLSGTVQRPQEAINELVLRDCDYLIVILGSRWGTPPQVGGGYDSGTEEEFFEALRLLADIKAPMRDMLVMFKDQGIKPDSTAQSKKVDEFRDRLERSRQILFNVFDNEFAFAGFVRGALQNWAPQDIAPFAREVTLPEPSSLPEISGDRQPRELLDIAQSKLNSGLVVQAERLFDAAIADGDPDSLAAYAKFMRRAGRYERSEELNNLILTSPSIADGLDNESASRRAMALAGIGIVKRKLGELGASKAALEEAVGEAQKSGSASTEAYVIDNLSHTLRQLGDVAGAQRSLDRSEVLRDDNALEVDTMTLVNEAREKLRSRDRKESLRLIEAVLSRFEPDQDPAMFASAKAVEARALFELGNYEACIVSAGESLTSNEKVKNDDGAAICESLISRAYLSLGDKRQARTYADRSQQRGIKSGNRTGEASGYWNLAQIAAAEDDLTEAAELTESALRVARDGANKPLETAIAHWFEAYIDQKNRT